MWPYAVLADWTKHSLIGYLGSNKDSRQVDCHVCHHTFLFNSVPAFLQWQSVRRWRCSLTNCAAPICITTMAFRASLAGFFSVFVYFGVAGNSKRLLIRRILLQWWKRTDNFVSSLPRKAASNADFLSSLLFLSPSNSYVGDLGLQFAVWPREQCTALHH